MLTYLVREKSDWCTPQNAIGVCDLGVHQTHAKPPNQKFLLQPPGIPVAASKDPTGGEAFCHLWGLQYCCIVAEHKEAVVEREALDVGLVDGNAESQCVGRSVHTCQAP